MSLLSSPRRLSAAGAQTGTDALGRPAFPFAASLHPAGIYATGNLNVA